MVTQVFTFWNDPIERAPLVVRMGIESWQKACKADNIKFYFICESNCSDFESRLSEKVRTQLESIRSYISNPNSYHSWRTYSDALRLALLSQLGGLWADPTTICNKPISSWTDLRPYGMKIPRYEGRAFSIESWLIASEKNNEILRDWSDHLLDYFERHPFLKIIPSRNYPRKGFFHYFNKISKSHPGFSSMWFSHFATKLWRRSDYFIIYHSFEHTLRAKHPLIPAHYIHFPLDGGMYKALITSDWSKFAEHWARERILSLPVLKLSWKRDNEATSIKQLPKSHLYWILNEQHQLIPE